MLTELNPKVDFPFVMILTAYPGASPDEVEQQISKPLEEAVASVPSLKNLTSTSQEGISTVGLEFRVGTDLKQAVADVREKVDAVRGRLPRGIDAPSITKMDTSSEPVLRLGLLSPRPSRELRTFAKEILKDKFGQVPGVASVLISGGDIREIQVNVNRDRLAAYGIGINTVLAAVASGNLNVPGGSITQQNREYAIRLIGELQKVDELRNLTFELPGGQGGSSGTIRMSDIATVEDVSAKRTEIARIQRKDSVNLTIVKQSDANTVDVANGIKEKLSQMKASGVLPSDIEAVISNDQSVYVEHSIEDVNMALFFGAFFAIVVVFLFLHNLRGTFIVSLAIPTSIIATFIVMYAAGFTLNTMTMMALALAVGILVDDSIVVLENIYRHLAMGKDPIQAAYDGRSEIGLAAIAITLTDVVVFVPIAFMGEIVGQFFRQFGITIAAATLFSLFISFTWTPMLASRLYPKGFKEEEASGFFGLLESLYHKVSLFYAKVLRWTLNNRFTTIAMGWFVLLTVFALMGGKQQIAGIILTVAALGIIGELILGKAGKGAKVARTAAIAIGFVMVGLAVTIPVGFGFFPPSDQGQISIRIETPTGTSLAATDDIVKRVEEVCSEHPEVVNIFTVVGSLPGTTGSTGTHLAQVSLQLRDKRGLLDSLTFQSAGKRTISDSSISDALRKKINQIPGAVFQVAPVTWSAGRGKPLTVELGGGTPEELNAAAAEVLRVFQETPGTLNSDLSWRYGRPEFRAHVDRERAASLGFTAQQIANAMRVAINGDDSVKFKEGGVEYPIRVQVAEADKQREDDIRNLVVGSADGRPVRLMDVASVDRGLGPTKIDRKNRQRIVTVSADVAKGFALVNVQQELQAKIAQLRLGRVQTKWGGEAEMFATSMGEMLRALMLAVVLVFMIMAALFESVFDPLVIMASLPQALAGAFLALMVTGVGFSIVAMIGFIMLVGLVTKNAILLVDYTNTLRSRGLSRTEAILQAGPTRLRPVLMTTSAMIMGMMPVALALGRGSEWRAPMGIAVIGGLILSTMLTLIVIPVTYTVVDDVWQGLRRLLGLRTTSREAAKGGELGQLPSPGP
jgi:HAE1 family hydrophobic/amphiphilic exporter-1